jgi:hypothetical protein
MSTFCSVNDDLLVAKIHAARRQLILIAPGIHMPVAEALADRLRDAAELQVTIILDGGEDVCRIGYGDFAALKRIHTLAVEAGLSIRSQPGLRIGALIADDQTIIWAPTPQAVEAPPQTAGDPSAPSFSSTPNGFVLDLDVGAEIARAIGAEGTDTRPDEAEVGKTAITPAQLAELDKALRDNPPIPIDLQRITRVFSTKLQFVEFEVRGAKLSRRKLTLPSDLINVDADDSARAILESALRPFSDFKDEPVKVPAFVDGKQVYDKAQEPAYEDVTEVKLSQERRALEVDFLYPISGFGTLIERARKREFEQRVEAYKVRMEAHAKGLREIVRKEMETVVEKVVALIAERSDRRGGSDRRGEPIDRDTLKKKLLQQIADRDETPPFVRCVFKDVTYEQTQDPEFRRKVDQALPAKVKKRLGEWYSEFSAALEGTVSR